MCISAVIAGGAALAGGALSASASGRAADAQSDAANAAAQLQRESALDSLGLQADTYNQGRADLFSFLDTTRTDTEPYRLSTQNALAALNFELGLGPRPTFGGRPVNALDPVSATPDLGDPITIDAIEGRDFERVPGSAAASADVGTGRFFGGETDRQTLVDEIGRLRGIPPSAIRDEKIADARSRLDVLRSGNGTAQPVRSDTGPFPQTGRALADASERQFFAESGDLDVLAEEVRRLQGLPQSDIRDEKLFDARTRLDALRTQTRGSENAFSGIDDPLVLRDERLRLEDQPASALANDRLFDVEQQQGAIDAQNRSEYSGFETTPGYEFRLSEAQKAIERSAAARGMLSSGATGQALTRFSQDYATNEYGTYMNRLAALAGGGPVATQGGGAGAAQLGANFANAASGTIMSGANAQGNALLAGGQAQAAGIMGGANAFNQTLGGLVGAAGMASGGAGPSAFMNSAPAFGDPFVTSGSYLGGT